MITVPPALRACSKVFRVSRSPVRHELMQCEPLVGPGLPVVEERRLDLGHARAIRIRLGRHVLSRVARGLESRRGTGRSVAGDELTWTMCSAAPGRLGRGDGLVQARAAAAHVDVRRTRRPRPRS